MGICKGYTEIAKLLLEKGADINHGESYGNTALLWATVKGCVEIVKLILEKNAGVNIQNNCGRTALMCASIKGYIEIVRLLLKKGANIYIQDNDKYTVLDFYCNTHVTTLLENYIFFKNNIKEFIPSYNILVIIFISTSIYYIPNEIILLIKEYGEIVCGINY